MLVGEFPDVSDATLGYVVSLEDGLPGTPSTGWW